jgi:hypothetical protein
MTKARKTLILIALALLTLFPPWVLTRTITVSGEGYWTLEKWNNLDRQVSMEMSQEIGRFGHRPFWWSISATPYPNLTTRERSPNERLETKSLEVKGPMSVQLDVRLLLSEYLLVIGIGLLLPVQAVAKKA